MKLLKDIINLRFLDNINFLILSRFPYVAKSRAIYTIFYLLFISLLSYGIASVFPDVSYQGNNQKGILTNIQILSFVVFIGFTINWLIKQSRFDKKFITASERILLYLLNVGIACLFFLPMYIYTYTVEKRIDTFYSTEEIIEDITNLNYGGTLKHEESTDAHANRQFYLYYKRNFYEDVVDEIPSEATIKDVLSKLDKTGKLEVLRKYENTLKKYGEYDTALENDFKKVNRLNDHFGTVSTSKDRGKKLYESFYGYWSGTLTIFIGFAFFITFLRVKQVMVAYAASVLLLFALFVFFVVTLFGGNWNDFLDYSSGNYNAGAFINLDAVSWILALSFVIILFLSRYKGIDKRLYMLFVIPILFNIVQVEAESISGRIIDITISTAFLAVLLHPLLIIFDSIPKQNISFRNRLMINLGTYNNKLSQLNHYLSINHPLLWRLRILVPIMFIVLVQIVLVTFYFTLELSPYNPINFQQVYSYIIIFSSIPLIFWFYKLHDYPNKPNALPNSFKTQFSTISIIFILSFGVLGSSYWFCLGMSNKLGDEINTEELASDIALVRNINRSIFSSYEIDIYDYFDDDIYSKADTSKMKPLDDKVRNLSLNNIPQSQKEALLQRYLLLFEKYNVELKYNNGIENSYIELREQFMKENSYSVISLYTKLESAARAQFLGLSYHYPPILFIIFLVLLALIIDLDQSSYLIESRRTITFSLVLFILHYFAIFDFGNAKDTLPFIGAIYVLISLFFIIWFVYSFIRKNKKNVIFSYNAIVYLVFSLMLGYILLYVTDILPSIALITILLVIYTFIKVYITSYLCLIPYDTKE
jgi:hypothetical protein